MNELTPEQRIARAMAEDAQINATNARERHLDPAHAHAAPNGVAMPRQLRNEVRKRLYGPGYVLASNLLVAFERFGHADAVPFFWTEEDVERSSAEFEVFDGLTSPTEIIPTLKAYLLTLEPEAEHAAAAPEHLELKTQPVGADEPFSARGRSSVVAHVDELGLFKTNIVEASSDVTHTSEVTLPALELINLNAPEVLADPQAFIALRDSGSIVGCVRKTSIPKEALDNLTFETLTIEEALNAQKVDGAEDETKSEKETEVAIPEDTVAKMEQILNAQKIDPVPPQAADTKLEPAAVYQDSRYAGKSTNVPNGKFSKKGTRGTN